jgi:hypothetical protein
VELGVARALWIEASRKYASAFQQVLAKHELDLDDLRKMDLSGQTDGSRLPGMTRNWRAMILRMTRPWYHATSGGPNFCMRNGGVLKAGTLRRD